MKQSDEFDTRHFALIGNVLKIVVIKALILLISSEQDIIKMARADPAVAQVFHLHQQRKSHK